MIKIAVIVLVAIIVFITSSIIIGSMTFNKKIKNEVEQIFKKNKEAKTELVTEAEIERLPEPVQRYLTIGIYVSMFVPDANASIKGTVCNAVGCPNGSRMCAIVGMPPLQYYCYENPPKK